MATGLEADRLNADRLKIVVTVGMGHWPFDRLLAAVKPLCAEHEVFAQTGTSSVTLPCPQRDFVPYPELVELMERADVVITHAGNTVRLVQRMGKVPLAVARTRALAEMADDHQVAYLREEERRERVHAVWDVRALQSAVRRHADERPRLPGAALDPPVQPERVADRLDQMWRLLRDNPFRDHPIRRYAYAWEELMAEQDRLDGPHLDIGSGQGDFLAALATTAHRECQGVDVHAGYVAAGHERHPGLPISHVLVGRPLPFADATFASATLLDVLEHCDDDDALLREAHRILKPGGLLVLTVPARHVLSFLDPDNVKYRLPRIHRAVYTARFGTQTYRRRFVDVSDGLLGDTAAGRGEHTNYRLEPLINTLVGHGFTVRRRSGANLLWQLLHGPGLLAGPRLAKRLDQAILADGRVFQAANLFLTLVKDGST